MSVRRFRVTDELQSEVKRLLRLYGSTPQAADEIIEYVRGSWYPKLSPNPFDYEAFRWGHITMVVCQHFSLQLHELRKKTRKRNILYPRQILQYFLAMQSNYHLTYIGEFFGQDHTTVMASRNVIMQKMRKELRVQQDVTAILRLLKRLKRSEIVSPDFMPQMKAI